VDKQFVVTAGPDKGRVFPLPAADSLLLGRSRAAELRLVDPYVSRLHCRVEVTGDRVVLLDNDSAGGTFVNGRRLAGPQALRAGDVVRVGETELQLQTLADGASTWPPAAPAPGALATPGAVPLPLGELVGQTISRYQVGPVLAKGLSGVVFHARDTEADLPVAFKVLDPRLADASRRDRFVRAMKTVLRLRHDNLIPVYAAGKSGPYCWVAMEYVQGEGLTQWVQRAGTPGTFDGRLALRVAVHVARALEYAHRQQVLHRNVSPMNIVVRGRDQTAKLGDLMLAKALEGELALNLTRPGEVLGDLNYLSPERTHPGAPVDERSDLFSLGATLYAVLTGQPPFADVSPIETIKKLRAGEVVPPRKVQPAVSDPFERVVLKLLARRPEDRYQTATELLAELKRLTPAGDPLGR
jgi:hypothetical protein